MACCWATNAACRLHDVDIKSLLNQMHNSGMQVKNDTIMNVVATLLPFSFLATGCLEMQVILDNREV
jgi:hypothetical protein